MSFPADPAVNPTVLSMKSNLLQISHTDISVTFCSLLLVFFLSLEQEALFSHSNEPQDQLMLPVINMLKVKYTW